MLYLFDLLILHHQIAVIELHGLVEVNIHRWYAYLIAGIIHTLLAFVDIGHLLFDYRLRIAAVIFFLQFTCDIDSLFLHAFSLLLLLLFDKLFKWLMLILFLRLTLERGDPFELFFESGIANSYFSGE